MIRTGLLPLLVVPVAAMLGLVGCGGRDDEGAPAGPSSERVTLRPAGSVEGAPLGYVEYLPPGYGDGAERPLLVFMHGVAENGDGSEVALRRLFKLGLPLLIETDDWRDELPFVVLMPQYGPDEATECEHADEIDSFLEFALDRYAVDADRVYLTGVSCGAIGAWDYLAAHGDSAVAAAVLVSGHATWAFDKAGCALGRVPVWAFHGAADEIVPPRYIRTPIAALEACTPRSAEMRLTIYPRRDHDAWSGTYDLKAGHDIYAWLLAHERE